MVFPSPRGKDAPMYDAKTPWNIIREKADLKDIRLHDLRRHYATNLLESGTRLDMVGRLLNYKDRSTTLVYAHRAMQSQREAVAKLDTHFKTLLVGNE